MSELCQFAKLKFCRPIATLKAAKEFEFVCGTMTSCRDAIKFFEGDMQRNPKSEKADEVQIFFTLSRPHRRSIIFAGQVCETLWHVPSNHQD